MESTHKWQDLMKNPKRRGQRIQIFVTNDLPGLEEAIKSIFPDLSWQLGVIHAVLDTLKPGQKS